MVLRQTDLPVRSLFLAKPFTPAVLSQKVLEALSISGTNDAIPGVSADRE
jgi:hypothetical protein